MNYLSFYRKQARKRQFDIAKQLGVTEQLISKWECGRSEPQIEQAVDVARILGVEPGKIFPGMFGINDSDNKGVTHENLFVLQGKQK